MLHNNKEKGFTLIEVLLVLSVLAVLTSLSILHLKPLNEKKTIDFFFEQLQNDLFYAQQYAISHNETVKVVFQDTKPQYSTVIGGINSIVQLREFDKAIKIQFATLGSTLYFNSSGNINKSGTMLVIYKKTTYRVTFLLGKGRFYVTRL